MSKFKIGDLVTFSKDYFLFCKKQPMLTISEIREDCLGGQYLCNLQGSYSGLWLRQGEIKYYNI